MKTSLPADVAPSVRRPRASSARIQYGPADWERLHSERPREDDERSPFEIDRSRIIHCAAFRRLQGKTQIFGVVHDNFYRTRLTHSLEVAQIAKGIALICHADTELVEAISLAHDIGHPPFGHAGERALDLCMQTYAGARFESNAQNLRTLALLEAKQTGYPGLNLTRATLDGLLKHKSTGDARAAPVCYASEAELMAWVTREAPPDALSLEAQIVDWADQVAYSVHDLEDGVHSGMITSARMSDPQVAGRVIEQVTALYSHAPTDQIYQWLMAEVRDMEQMGDARQRAAERKQLTSSLIHRFVTAAKLRRRKWQRTGNGQAADLAPSAPRPAALGAPDGAETASRKHELTSDRYGYTLFIPEAQRGRAAVLNEIARQLIIADQRVSTLEHRSAFVVRQLFAELMRLDATALYPEDLRDDFAAASDEPARARVACDFIAGMTDSYAEMFFQRLFSPGANASNSFDRF